MALHDTFKADLVLVKNRKNGEDVIDIANFMFIEVAIGKGFIMPFPMSYRLGYTAAGNIAVSTASNKDFEFRVNPHVFELGKHSSFPPWNTEGSVQRFGDC